MENGQQCTVNIVNETCDDISSKATELSDMKVIDEVGYEDTTEETSDNRDRELNANHPICIFNWEVIAVFLSRVGAVKQQRFFPQKQRMRYESANITDPASLFEEQLMFVDSHFHLEQILRNGNNWASDVGFARGVYVAFGIPPHLAAKIIFKRQMIQQDSLKDNNSCVAIVGLDYTTTCICRACRNPSRCKEEASRHQEEAFIHMLLLARRRSFPVIIHCRDFVDGSAAKRTYEIIFHHDLADIKSYRHCFEGTTEELTACQQLPSIIF
ncbi:tatD [Mytilus coruscus]|uniref:TatD n=1 Tax=Mytilus coruscus TaxID=42192 RepID=A0A6J8CFB3_MYTCO|nr:tatD [Mytilus coruscus]